MWGQAFGVKVMLDYCKAAADPPIGPPAGQYFLLHRLLFRRKLRILQCVFATKRFHNHPQLMIR